MSALTTFFLEDPDRARLLLREALDRPTELRALLVKYVRPWVAVVSEQLERARRDGFVHDDVDVDAYAVHVIHLVVGGVAVMETMGAALGGRSNVTRDRLTKELMRLARAGLFVDSGVRRARSVRPVELASSEGTKEPARARRTGVSEKSERRIRSGRADHDESIVRRRQARMGGAMANFYKDNADLQFYVEKGIDWSRVVELTERRSSTRMARRIWPRPRRSTAT